jgi:uncharacterized protein (DUF849 family)
VNIYGPINKKKEFRSLYGNPRFSILHAPVIGGDFRWSVLGAGASQLRIAAQAAAMGGNVRVGLEDSIWAGRGKLAESSTEQIMMVRKIIEGLGKTVATPDEAREMLALKGAGEVAF